MLCLGLKELVITHLVLICPYQKTKSFLLIGITVRRKRRDVNRDVLKVLTIQRNAGEESEKVPNMPTIIPAMGRKMPYIGALRGSVTI